MTMTQEESIPTTTVLRALTAEDRSDVTEMLAHFLMCTDWVDHDSPGTRKERDRYPEHMANLERKRALAHRLGAEYTPPWRTPRPELEGMAS